MAAPLAAVAGALPFFADRLLDGGKAHRINIPNHGHNQAGWRASRDAHMHKVLINYIGAIYFGIDFGNLLQSVAAGFGEERHEAKFDTMLL